MAGIKISELELALAPNGTEQVEVTQNGASRRATPVLMTANGDAVVTRDLLAGRQVLVNISGLIQHDGTHMYLRPINGGGRLVLGAGNQNFLTLFENGALTLGPSSTVAVGQTIQANNVAQLTLYSARSDAGEHATVVGIAARGSISSPAIVQNNDRLFAVSAFGFDGNEPIPAGNIVFLCDGTPGDNDMPGKISFGTTPDGAAVPSTTVLMNNVGACFFARVGTTAGAANAFLDPGSSPANNLLRSTSSLRYKRDAEPLDPAIADRIVSALRPIWYRSTAPADRADWSWYGLGAEDVAAVDPRLVAWGYRDEDLEDVPVMATEETAVPTGVIGPDGRALTRIETTEKVLQYERRPKEGAVKVPDGVAYDRLAVLLLDVVRRQGQRLAALEAKVAALKA